MKGIAKLKEVFDIDRENWPILVVAFVHMGKKDLAPTVTIPVDLSYQIVHDNAHYNFTTCTCPALSAWCPPGSQQKCHAPDT